MATGSATSLRSALEGRRTVYLVRHGATKLNDQTDLSVDRERGWSDVPLEPEGRAEAQAAALKLKPKDIQAIVSSDLVRAKETAQIIGKALGIKPEFSFRLRPWNLGDLTGKVMTEAKPQILAYAKKPDDKVPGGESFNAFKARTFQGVSDAIAKHHDQIILIVAHHRVERLLEAWQKAGEPEDHSIDLNEFMAKGDPPGGVITLEINEKALKPSGEPMDYPTAPESNEAPAAAAAPAQKLSHEQVDYGQAKGKDKCMTCKSFRGKDDCKKVVPPIAAGGWCKVGHSRIDGHAYDAATEAVEDQPKNPVLLPPGSSDNMAHGRAIAGAKALHAVGHISGKERDKHIAKSQAAIRKPFGAFAPRA